MADQDWDSAIKAAAVLGILVALNCSEGGSFGSELVTLERVHELARSIAENGALA